MSEDDVTSPGMTAITDILRFSKARAAKSAH